MEYWAKKPADELVKELKRKRKEFLDVMESTGLSDRILESWAMYHGMRNFHLGDSIEIAGAQGELRLVSLNEFRSSLSLLRSYVTANRVEWDTIAQSGDAKALTAAKRGNQILDAAIEDTRTGAEQCLSQAVEDALILTAGYVFLIWDPTLGKEERGDIETNAIYRSGDIRCVNPCIFDVAFDYHVRDFRESRWVEVRRQENKWDLIAEHPDLADDIERLKMTSLEDRFDLQLEGASRRDNDFLWVSYFYHLPTPAIPNGRFLRRVDEVSLEEADELPDGHIPLHRMVPAQFMLTPFGFTPAFSCQAPQRMLDAAISTIATNTDALGSSKVWKKPGEPINRGQLENGIVLIETETKPEVLNLLSTAPEVFKGLEIHQGYIRSLSSVNDSAHGQPQASLKSGAAIAFTEQRVEKAATDIIMAYDGLCAGVGTSYLKIQEKRVQGKRNVTVTKGRKRQFDSYSAEDLQGIDRVSVVRGNPLMRTRAQRIQIAEFLLERNVVTPDEFLTVITRGNLDKLTERAENQLDIVHMENELIQSGRQEHIPLPTDNHVLHARIHTAAADAAVRYGGDPTILRGLLAAAQQHKDMLDDPEIAKWQGILGYGPQAPPGGDMGPPPGGDMGAPPPLEMPGVGPEGGGPQLVGAPMEGAAA